VHGLSCLPQNRVVDKAFGALSREAAFSRTGAGVVEPFHAAEVAACHRSIAFALKRRSVRREMRWTLKVEGVLDGRMNGKEALGRPR
jgi:hypothetical protein